MFCLKARLLDALGSILSTTFFFLLMDSIEAGEVRRLAALFQNTQVLFSGSVTPIPGNLILCPLNSTNTRHTGAHTYTHAHTKPIKVTYLGAS